MNQPQATSVPVSDLGLSKQQLSTTLVSLLGLSSFANSEWHLKKSGTLMGSLRTQVTGLWELPIVLALWIRYLFLSWGRQETAGPQSTTF